MDVAPAILYWQAAFYLAAATATRIPAPLTLLLMASTALIPTLFETTNAMRCMHGMATITHGLRLVRIVESPECFSQRSAMFRIAFCAHFHDLSRLGNSLKRTGALRSLVLTTLGAVGATVLASSGLMYLGGVGPMYLGRGGLLLRWACGAVKFAASMYILDGLYRLPLLAMGKSVPAALQNPQSSNTVAEFWSRRWNLVIGGMLREGIFEPCRRWGLNGHLAAALTFVTSGLLHVVPMVLSRQPIDVCACMFLFFVAQIPLLAVERALGLRGTAWVWLALAAVAPLFVESFLRCFDPDGADERLPMSVVLLYFVGV